LGREGLGLLSIGPTRAFIRWTKQASADAAFLVPEAEAKRVRRIAVIETHLVAVLVLFAALMARGIGS